MKEIKEEEEEEEEEGEGERRRRRRRRRRGERKNNSTDWIEKIEKKKIHKKKGEKVVVVE